MSIYNNNGPHKPANQPGRINSLSHSEVTYMPVEEDEIDLMRYLALFKKRWRLMAITVAVILGLGVIYTLLQRPVYESKVALLVTSSKSNPLAALANASPLLSEMSIPKSGNSIDTVAALISERDTLESAFMSLDKKERADGFDNTELLPDWAMKVDIKQNTDVIEVKVRSFKPATAAKLANDIVNNYMTRDIDRSSKNIQHARRYTQDNMLLIERQLSQANKDLAEYKKEQGLFSPDAQLAKAAEYMATLQLDLENSAAELAACNREVAVIEMQIEDEKPSIKSSTVIKQNPSFASVTATIDELYKTRTEQLEEYTPKSQEILALDSRIASHQKQLKNIAETVVEAETNVRNPIRDEMITAYSTGLAKQAALQARIDSLKKGLDSVKIATSEMPERQRELTELVQQTALLERTYGMVSEKYYALLISEKGISPNAQIVSRARAEKAPISPSLVKNGAVSMMVGIVFAVLLVLGTEAFDPRLRDKETVERLTGYFALAVVPQAPAKFSPLTSMANSYAPILESFRVLRNNVYFAGIETKSKVLAITSTLQGEGKSVAAINLAGAMAMDGKRVLLVDCNMHRPSLRAMTNVQCSIGLTNVLSGACDVDKAIVSTSQENVFLLPTGPIMLNFVESLNSERGRKTFMQCAEQYDAVIIDCPSMANFSEIQMISTLSDHMLLVVSQQVKGDQLTAVMHSLAQVGCPVMGVVINGSEPAQGANGFAGRNGSSLANKSDDVSTPMKERV